MLPLFADTFIFFSSVPSTELAAARQSKARAGKEPVSLPNTIVANTKTHRDCCKYKDTQKYQIQLLRKSRNNKMHSQSVQYTLWKHKMARTTKSIQHPVPGSAYYDPKYIHCKMISAIQDWFVCKEVGQAQQMHLVPKQAKDSSAAPLIICRVRHLRPDRC